MSASYSDTDRLRRLQELTDSALINLELEQLLAAVLARVKDLLDADTSAILLLDEERKELVARAAIGLEEGVKRGVRIPVGRGFAGTVAARRSPVILPDVDHAEVLNPVLREKRVRSLLGVPLLLHGAVLGVLHVGTLVARSFSDEDVELLQFAADRAAIAIDHARLFEAERSARVRLEHVQAVTDIALSHLALEELLDVLLPRIREILRTDTCAVLLLESERRELVARGAVGLEEEVQQGVRIPLGKGFAGRVAAERTPVVLDDVDHADVLNPILRRRGVKSLLGVPLLIREQAIGVLHVGTLSPRQFSSEDVELLQLVAERLALAVERARLHEEVRLLDQLRSNFVAIASHELRTPATAVYGALATLVERGSTLPPETREQLLVLAYEQGERLTRLLEQLLDLSRLDANRLRITPTPLVVGSTLEKIVRQTLPPEIPVDVDVPVDLAVVADPLALDRIVSNLLLNAARHGAPPIRVRAEQRDSHFRIAVRDHGAGIPDELRARMFERFERGDDGRGSGLGLAIARAYARAHGGELVYTDEGGAPTFELVVPTE